MTSDPRDKLRGGLVVSCQPVDNGPMDRPDIIAAMALAAEAGGASGLRIEGAENLRAVRPLIQLPIIAIVKCDLVDSEVRITPFVDHVAALAAAGADIIAYDATQRQRPVPTAALVAAIAAAGRIAMADCARIDDGTQALAEGAGILGTTLAGYAYGLKDDTGSPDFSLISAFKALDTFVMAEGRYNVPDLAARARLAGADCVTVGSAITRVEHITGWFAAAVGNMDEQR